MRTFTSFLRRPVVIGVMIIVAALGGYFALRPGEAPPETVAVTRGTVVEEVSVTGRVKAVQAVDLGFERAGRVARVAVKVGDTVSAGTLLALEDQSELVAQLRDAQANAAAENARLDELRRGTRPEELQVKETELKAAVQDLANSYAGVLDIVNDAYAKADDGVRARADAFFTDGDTASPRLAFTVSDTQAQIDVVALRRRAGDELRAWKQEIEAARVSSGPAILDRLLAASAAHLEVARSFLSRALDALQAAVGVSATNLDTWKANVNAARTNVNAAVSAVSAKSQAIAAGALAVERLEGGLALARAGATSEQIAAQEAKVLQAEAKVANAEAQLRKTTLRAPFGGLVTRVEAKVGEIAAANAGLIGLISERALELEANIPESDIAKVAVGDEARVTLDAYGSAEVFGAKVTAIDPSETVIEGISTYRTTFTFTSGEERAKPGMTANIDITTERRENVLLAPPAAIAGRNRERTAKVLRPDGSVVEVPVLVGLRGAGGTLEILEGLKEGDRLVLPTLTK